MRQVLIIAYYFPPIAASGAMRPLAFARFLGEVGWRPRVLAVDPDSVVPPHPIDPQLLSKLPANVRVDRIAHPNPLQTLVQWRNRIRELVRGRRGNVSSTPSSSLPAPGAAAQPQVTGLAQLKHLVLDWWFAFPDPQCPWLQPAIAWAKRWPTSEVPDVVMATGGPWTSLCVGQVLAAHWKVPFVADYRDPWTNNPYVAFQSDWLNEKSRRLEQVISRQAAGIIANTEELREQLSRRDPAQAHKVVTITNGYDPDSFPARDQSGGMPSDRSSPAKGIEVCHFGTVYGKRTPRRLLEAVGQLYEEGQFGPAQLRFRFVGAWEVEDAACEQVAQQLEKVGVLKREPPVPYQDCLRQMAVADALLVIQPDSPLQIPGKIYEYVATRRPMLLIGGEGATANLVHRFRLGLACPNDPSRIRQVLLDLVKDPQRLATPDSQHIERFDYRQLTASLAQVLDQACVGVGRHG